MRLEIEDVNPEGAQIVPFIPPQLTAEQAQAVALVATARGMVVSDQKSYDVASQFVQDATEKYNAAEKLRKYHKEPILESGRRLDAAFKPLTESLDMARCIVRDEKMLPWALEQDRIKKQREAEAEAAAERERQRLAALAAENERKAREAEAAGKIKEAERYATKADMQQQAAAVVAAPVVAPTFDRGSAVIRQNWKGEGMNLLETVKAAASGNAMALGFLMYNEQAITKQAKASKDAIQVPGISFFNDPGMAVGKR